MVLIQQADDDKIPGRPHGEARIRGWTSDSRHGLAAPTPCGSLSSGDNRWNSRRVWRVSLLKEPMIQCIKIVSTLCRHHEYLIGSDLHVSTARKS